MRDRSTVVLGGFRRSSPTLGAWSSPRLAPCHGPLRSGRYHGRSSQAVDPAQDGSEQVDHLATHASANGAAVLAGRIPTELCQTGSAGRSPPASPGTNSGYEAAATTF